MTETARKIASQKDWINVELNPERDLLASLAAKLSSENELARLFQSAEINLSFFGLGLEVKGAAPITEIETALQKMLLSLKKKGKRLLISIDEVTNTPQMRAFAAAFQIFLRQDLPVFLLMTGLFKVHQLSSRREKPDLPLPGPENPSRTAQHRNYCRGLPDDSRVGRAGSHGPGETD